MVHCKTGKQLCGKGLVDYRLNRSQLHAYAAKAALANGVLDCIGQRLASKWREGILSLCSALVRLQLELGPILGPSVNVDILVRVQQRAMKIRNLSYKQRLSELGLFRLEKRRLRWGGICLPEGVGKVQRKWS